MPDSKDWTWVLERVCEECGFDSSRHAVADLPALIRESTWLFGAALRQSDHAVRPSPSTWSTLEYVAHVRDVHRVFAERLRLMLAQDAPTFANWDQDQSAEADDYASQDRDVLDVELVEAAAEVAGIYAGIQAAQLDRLGRRSDGNEFTIESLGRYHLHDVVHHLHDIGWDLGQRGDSWLEITAVRE